MGGTPETTEEETPAQIVRRARGRLSLDKFAAQLGTSRQRVIAWEKGRSLPSEQYAEQIAEIADVDRSALERDEPGGLPEQITAVYALLDELRATAERKGYLGQGEGGDEEIPPALDARLRALEATVETAGAAVTTSLAALARDVRKLGRQIEAQAPPATKKRAG